MRTACALRLATAAAAALLAASRLTLAAWRRSPLAQAAKRAPGELTLAG